MLWIAYFLAVNALAFAAFAEDKRRAVAGRDRLREDTLLALAFVGGSPGAIAAQQLFRHKTRKEPFRTVLLGILGLQALAAIGWLVLR